MTDVAPGSAGQGAPDGGAAAALIPTSTQTNAAPPAPAAGAAPEAIDWLKGADEATVGYVKNKGWQEPSQVLDGYRNLEKLLGADRAGRTVVLPKEGATPEEMGAFYERLGRPSDPGGYKFDIPQGYGDPEFAKAAATKFHELGISKAQGDALAAWWNETAGGAMQKSEAAKIEARQQAGAELQKEWGQAFEQNKVIVDNVARGLGLDEATVLKLGDALGPAGAMKLLHQIGAKMGESNFVTGEEKQGFGAAMTPAQAKAEIETLRQDKAFVARYMNKDADALAKMERLHAFAFPDERR